MQMRFVTLTKGWYKKDSGVLIGYYVSNKTLAVMIPTSPDKYKVITKDFPNGMPIDEVPARKLKVMDLVKFMFRQSGSHDNYTC